MYSYVKQQFNNTLSYELTSYYKKLILNGLREFYR